MGSLRLVGDELLEAQACFQLPLDATQLVPVKTRLGSVENLPAIVDRQFFPFLAHPIPWTVRPLKMLG